MRALAALETKTDMNRRATAGFLTLLTGVLCVPYVEGCKRNSPPPITMQAGPGGALAFPPPDEGWSERTPLPEKLSKGRLRGDEVIRLETPTIDKNDHFEFAGQTLHLAFTADVFARAKDAPAVEITPKIAGKTVWSGSTYAEFKAEKPFDPDVEYTLSIAATTGPSGKTFEGVKATFKATPAIEIAGKTITYLPTEGHPRIVAVVPNDVDKVGGAQEITAIYDQPVDLALAKTLITVTEGDEKAVAVSLRHPASNTFDGVKVDPRYLVVAKPNVKLAPGTTIQMHARSKDDENDRRDRTYTVASPTDVETINDEPAKCGNNGMMKMPVYGSIRAKLSNALDVPWDEANKVVHVTPKPPNVYVSIYDAVQISGSFEPSTTYTVSVDAVKDIYGGKSCPFSFTMQTRPLPASATLSEGVMLLDEADLRTFSIATRNVVRGSLELWPLPKGDVTAFTRAVADASRSSVPNEAPTVVAFTPKQALNQFVDTTLDLGTKLERGRAYVARAQMDELVADAEISKSPVYREKRKVGLKAARPAQPAPPVSVLFPAGPNALGAHVHRAGDKAAVQVFRLSSGEPVGGARVTLGKETVTTDDLGSALLPAPASEPHDNTPTVVAIASNEDVLMMPLEQLGPIASSSLFPELGTAYSGSSDDRIGMIVTDRGVYRPGSILHVKAFARKFGEGAVKAIGRTKLRLVMIDPMDTSVFDKILTSSDKGTIVQDVTLDKGWHTGRYQLRLELADDAHTVLANEQIRVSPFETPKFKVDVEAASGADKLPANKVRARVTGTYLFGAPMDGAHVRWTIQKEPARVNGGAFEDAGLVFDRETYWWDEDRERTSLTPVVGEGKLGADGTFLLDADTGALAEGPTDLTIEADVNDASNRHIAGSFRTRKDPFTKHAGLKLTRRFAPKNQAVHVDLGVVDPRGQAVENVPMTARLERLTWTRSATKAESGAVVEQWTNVPSVVGTCTVNSAKSPIGCDLQPDKGGSFRVVASIEGRDDASVSYWAYSGADWSDDERAPSSGKKVPIVLDKAKYSAGETAHLLAQSPYKKALALLTVEQGGILKHQSKRIEGPAATFDVALEASNAPWVNAVVTLLPIDETEADYRVAATRIPVAEGDAKLKIAVASDKKKYETGDEASITISVKGKDGQGVKNADVALAVVDEGVLRMTSFHAKDAATELHPGRNLAFSMIDSRAAMLARREKAHVAGGGDGSGEDELNTRRKFVETAAWLPNLTTDGNGNVTAKVKLPDNLTEFRMMAVVVDDVGRGGSAESSFVVSKALMLEPVMPRFALRGDTFEAAAMVHNNTDAPVAAKVNVAGLDRDLTIPANGHERVAVPMTADRSGSRTMTFSLATGGTVRDKVEIPFVIDEPGLEQRPAISGAFTARQEVQVEIPRDAIFEDGAALSIKTGSALYPELGQRLTYLLDYPHGCVEQTTSSMLPLLAARTILPWTGTSGMEDAELKKRIQAGVDRLASMRTPSNGLAYWPGSYDPNVYGTAYALRALLRARAIGIETPGLIPGIIDYLQHELSDGDPANGLRVSIAEVLALDKALPESAADSLYDTREKLDAFGLGSLAVALASLPHQEDRVREILDKLEASFDETGKSKSEHGKDDWYYWSSNDRDRAEAVIALAKLRKDSRLLPILAERLTHKLERWTTQSTAWSLMALSDFVGDRDPKGSVDVGVKLEGRILDTFRKLGGDNKEVRIPLKDLAGKKVTLVLEGDGKTASAFAMTATYKRPYAAAGTRLARRGPQGMSIYRAYSDMQGRPIDLAHVKAGQIVRVAVRAELPSIDEYRRGYVAITDRLPAGLAPMDPDLATTTNVPDLLPEHPFYEGLTGYVNGASHIDLRDDKVQLYFDQIWSGTAVYATYLTRATTPGKFTTPPAWGELMYEPGSDGYSDASSLTVE